MKVKFIVFFMFLFLSVSYSFAQEPFIGEIKMFAGDFAPRGWAFCDGQLLSVSENLELFSILGTTYGGDGRTTFGLPDLRGRTAVHSDVHSDNTDVWTNFDETKTSHGIRKVRLGQRGGSEKIKLYKVHVFEIDSGESKNTNTIKSNDSELYKRDPYLGVHYIIALQGKYPSRS